MGEKSLFGKAYMGILRGHAVISPEGVIEDCGQASAPMSVEQAVKFVDQRA